MVGVTHAWEGVNSVLYFVKSKNYNGTKCMLQEFCCFNVSYVITYIFFCQYFLAEISPAVWKGGYTAPQ